MLKTAMSSYLLMQAVPITFSLVRVIFRLLNPACTQSWPPILTLATLQAGAEVVYAVEASKMAKYAQVLADSNPGRYTHYTCTAKVGNHAGFQRHALLEIVRQLPSCTRPTT